MPNGYGTPAEAAVKYQVARKTIYNWVKAGALDYIRLPGRAIRVNLHQFDSEAA